MRHWRRALAAAKAEAQLAAEEHAQAIQDRIAAESDQQEARKVVKVLRRHLDSNGWTEKLIEAMGGGA